MQLGRYVFIHSRQIFLTEELNKHDVIVYKKTMRAADEKLIINKLVDWYFHFHGFVRSAIFVTVDDCNMDKHLQRS